MPRTNEREKAQLAAVLMELISGRDNTVYNPQVVRVGDKVIIPEGAHLPEVIDSLQRQYDREEQRTKIHVTVPVSPWDGAMALMKAIELNLGLVIQQSHFGSTNQMDVEVELGKTIQVPWGSFDLPGMEGAEVHMDTKIEGGRMVFACTVVCKRKFEERIRRLLDTLRMIATTESLHKGKAFSIAFHDEDGDVIMMPKPKFFEYVEETPIFTAELEAAIERNIFVPLQMTEQLVEMRESLKRGVLFAGDYGVGKTLLASHIARMATNCGWTFVYVKDATELPDALRYAKQFQPVVVFAEDVDRVAGEERTEEVNDLLNQLDGIDSKSAQIMTILTSNHPDRINPAMRRPGRIDLVLEVRPPDTETVARMIKSFAKGSLAEKADLSEASQILEGQTPARVRETVGRSKLEALRRTGKAGSKITGADLAMVAKEVVNEAKLFAKKQVSDSTDVTALAAGFEGAAKAMRAGMNGGSHPAHL